MVPRIEKASRYLSILQQRQTDMQASHTFQLHLHFIADSGVQRTFLLDLSGGGSAAQAEPATPTVAPRRTSGVWNSCYPV